MGISYVVGDATQPRNEGSRIIAHICNDVGGWGHGFVVAVSKQWLEPELAYRAWHAKGENFALGMVQLVKLPDGIIVANMIAQHGYASPGHPAIQYPALHMCLSKVAKRAKELGTSIHMPRIGCGLAGGTWSTVETIILETMGDLDVTVYDLPDKE
jgi:O-acetyl-ADP-ribose deacetylase (regulator of RNase III)